MVNELGPFSVRAPQHTLVSLLAYLLYLLYIPRRTGKADYYFCLFILAFSLSRFIRASRPGKADCVTRYIPLPKCGGGVSGDDSRFPRLPGEGLQQRSELAAHTHAPIGGADSAVWRCRKEKSSGRVEPWRLVVSAKKRSRFGAVLLLSEIEANLACAATPDAHVLPRPEEEEGRGNSGTVLCPTGARQPWARHTHTSTRLRIAAQLRGRSRSRSLLRRIGGDGSRTISHLCPAAFSDGLTGNASCTPSTGVGK